MRLVSLVLAMGIVALRVDPAQAGPRENAWKMHNRLTGVPPSAEVLDQMTGLIAQNKYVEAARVAIENPYFYNLALKLWVAPWTNVDASPKVELNDFTATVIGIIRDDLPFTQVLQGDVIYTGRDGLAVGATAVPAYDNANNTHYTTMETGRVDLKADLARRQQSTVTGVTDTAGVLTTRGFGSAYLSAGTNRRAIRFTMMNFLCNDMEQLSDTTRPDFHIRRDVSRAPGGEASVFRNKCAGCHSGMDTLAGAFAFFDFRTDRVVHEPGVVQFKMNQNGGEFPDGWVTTDDSWFNNWTEGPNTRLGWPATPTGGNGVRSFGQMVANTQQFSTCMATKVFSNVCMRNGSDDADQSVIKKLATDFAADGKFSMKRLFAETAAACLRD